MRYKIAIITATRAEYGLLSPLIRAVDHDTDLSLDLIVTGMHLSEKFGHTIDEIIADGFDISYRIPILEDDNSPHGISVTMANAITRFADCFRDAGPDMVVILGDRTELLGIAAAAMNEMIPIAHIHGGEVTEGAVDDCVRHALSKMSYLHFASTETYRQRIIRMGEHPDRVYNVGSLGTENILHAKLMSESEVRSDIGIPNEMPYAVVTFHPVTLDSGDAVRQVRELCDAMSDSPEYFYLITMSNADAGGDKINEIMNRYAQENDHAKLAASLGMIRYLSTIKYASFVMGNSSSGVIEAPVLGTPTVNIGDRQRGRIMADTVIQASSERYSISSAMGRAAAMEHTPSRLFGDGDTSGQIVDIIKDYLINDRIDLKKGFYDS